MGIGRIAYLASPPLLRILLVGHISAAALGCTVYSELEGLARPEAGTPPSDGRTSPDGTPSDQVITPVDRAGGDTVVNADAPAADRAGDAPTDTGVPPGVDVTPRDASSDTGSDVSVGVDVTTDVITPDSASDAGIDRGVDIAVRVEAKGRPPATTTVTVGRRAGLRVV